MPLACIPGSTLGVLQVTLLACLFLTLQGLEIWWLRANLSDIADALATIANALVDQRNWKAEDRDNRTIDDLPPYVEPSVDLSPPKT